MADHRLFTLGNSNDTDTVYCLDTDTGKELWTFAYPCASTNHAMSIVPYGPAATPTLDEGRLYTLSREGDFFCLQAASGKVLWQKHLLRDLGGKRPVYGYANSPLIVGEKLYLDIGGTNGSTAALDKRTGAVLWQKGAMEAGYASGQVVTNADGKQVLFLFKGEALCAFDAASGQEFWRWPCTNRDFVNASTPLVDGDRVLVSTTNADGTQMLRWTESGAQLLWHSADLGTLFNNCILRRGKLYGFNDANRTSSQLVCLDAATGKTEWTFTGLEKGTFMMADEKLLVLTSRGELAVGEITPTGLNVLSRSQILGGRCWVAPVLVAGKIYCRNNDGQMVCLDAGVTSGK